jgi:hypothetical protein
MDKVWDGCTAVDITLSRIIRLSALSLPFSMSIYVLLYCYIRLYIYDELL